MVYRVEYMVYRVEYAATWWSTWSTEWSQAVHGLPRRRVTYGGEEMLGDGKHAEPAKAGSSLLEAEPFSTPKAVEDTGTTFFTAGGSLYGKIGKALPSAKCSEMTDTSHPSTLLRLVGEHGKPVDHELTTCLQTYSKSSSLADLHVQFGTGSLSGPMAWASSHSTWTWSSCCARPQESSRRRRRPSCTSRATRTR